MTFLRVIKCISLIVFILAIALCGVGHGFVLCEMNLFDKDATEKFMMQEIKDELKDYDDVISGLFNKEEKDVAASENATVSNATAIAATPSQLIAPAETVEEKDGGYSLEGKNEIIATVMKYGTYSAAFGWITNNVKGLEGSGINVCLFVALCAILLAFILHLISKKDKSVYGYILMIVGFLFFSAIIILGYYFTESILSIITGVFTGGTDDWALYRMLISTVCMVFAFLIGLPIYRCGVRQIACKRMKKLNAGLKRKIANYKARG